MSLDGGFESYLADGTYHPETWGMAALAATLRTAIHTPASTQHSIKYVVFSPTCFTNMDFHIHKVDLDTI